MQWVDLGRLASITHTHSDRLNAHDVLALVDFIAHHRSLAELELDCCGITDEMMSVLAPALPLLPRLTYLSLKDNIITREGMSCLCANLPLCASLEVLDLDGNDEVDDVADMLTAALTHMPSIQIVTGQMVPPWKLAQIAASSSLHTIKFIEEWLTIDDLTFITAHLPRFNMLQCLHFDR